MTAATNHMSPADVTTAVGAALNPIRVQAIATARDHALQQLSMQMQDASWLAAYVPAPDDAEVVTQVSSLVNEYEGLFNSLFRIRANDGHYLLQQRSDLFYEQRGESERLIRSFGDKDVEPRWETTPFAHEMEHLAAYVVMALDDEATPDDATFRAPGWLIKTWLQRTYRPLVEGIQLGSVPTMPIEDEASLE